MNINFELGAILPFVAPPALGALIGYVTNKVAIKMLFRPLKKWTILGIRVPMTPGVIPSKRNVLAENIGDMVGTHLLTSEELGKALNTEKFQKHLTQLIEQRMANVLSKDLACVNELVPEKYRTYYSIAVQTSIYKVKTFIQKYRDSEEFEGQLKEIIDPIYEDLMSRDLDSFLPRRRREIMYQALDSILESLFESDAMEEWLDDFVFTQLSGVIKQQKSLSEILPSTLEKLILETIENKTPDILRGLAELVKDPVIQEKIINGIKKAVDSFSLTLGPMGGMVQNFLNVETIEKIIQDYIIEKEDQLSDWLENEEVQKKVAGSLCDRVIHYLNTPFVEFLSAEKVANLNNLSGPISKRLVSILREDGVKDTIKSMLRDNIEIYLQGGSIQMGQVVTDLGQKINNEDINDLMQQKGLHLLRSNNVKELLSIFVESSVLALLNKPVGKLSEYIPQGIFYPLRNSLKNLTVAVLSTEVPGLVDSLNFKNIIKEKIDSLDLLTLERLLLSIMEEQFKYINLFGALLGFLIGCINILFIAGL